MLAAGMETAAQLGTRCGVPRQTAQRWLRMKEADLAGKMLLKVATAVGVRPTWLGSGCTPIRTLRNPDVERAVVILDSLNKKQREAWFLYAEKLAGK